MNKDIISNAVGMINDEYVVEAENYRVKDKDARVLYWATAVCAALVLVIAAVPLAKHIANTRIKPGYRITVPENYTIVAYDLGKETDSGVWKYLHNNEYDITPMYTEQVDEIDEADAIKVINVGGVEYRGKYTSTQIWENSVYPTVTKKYTCKDGETFTLDENGAIVEIDNSEYNGLNGGISVYDELGISATVIASKFISDLENYIINQRCYSGMPWHGYYFNQLINGVETTNGVYMTLFRDGTLVHLSVDRTDFSVVDPEAIRILASSDEAMAVLRDKIERIYSKVNCSGLEYDLTEVSVRAYRTADGGVGVRFLVPVTMLDDDSEYGQLGSDTADIFLTFGEPDPDRGVDDNNRITQKDAKKIREGMTEGEVISLIGKPAQDIGAGLYIVRYLYEGDTGGIDITYDLCDNDRFIVGGVREWQYAVLDDGEPHASEPDDPYSSITLAPKYGGRLLTDGYVGRTSVDLYVVNRSILDISLLGSRFYTIQVKIDGEWHDLKDMSDDTDDTLNETYYHESEFTLTLNFEGRYGELAPGEYRVLIDTIYVHQMQLSAFRDVWIIDKSYVLSCEFTVKYREHASA